MFQINGKYTTAKVWIDTIDESCSSQIHTFVNHPAFTNPIAIMPDCHAGKGSCIGFTMPLTDKLIPNIIGVDIGCGMLSIKLGKSLGMDYKTLDHKIRQNVPFGKEVHSRSGGMFHMKNDFPWKELNGTLHNFVLAYQQKFNQRMEPVFYDMTWFEDKCKKIGADLGRMIKSVGTLGGGNHFIEIGLDVNGDYWLTIHTGSRNFGKRICEYWQDIAVKRIKQDREALKRKEMEEAKATLTDKALFQKIQEIKQKYNFTININGTEFLEGEDSHGYLYDMLFAQKYAEVNRAEIAKIILNILKIPEVDRIETVHNFVDFRDFVVRKGSIRSYEGERMIIPFNMRDGILICEGKSNPDWNNSAPHGAGRVFSRAEAKRKIDINVFKNQMKDIFSTSVCEGTLDEAPDAYKDSKIIEQAIQPTATIINRIIPVMNLKATEMVDE